MKLINHTLDKITLTSREFGAIGCSPVDSNSTLAPSLFTDCEDVIALQASGPFGNFHFHELRNKNYCVRHDSYQPLEDINLSTYAEDQALGLYYNLKSNFHCSINGAHENYMLKHQYNMIYSPSFAWEYDFRKQQQYANFGIIFTLDYLQRCGEAFPFLSAFLKRVKMKVPAIANETHATATPEMMVVIQSILHCGYAGTLKKMYLDSKVPELLLLSLQNVPGDSDLKVTLHQSDIRLIHKAKEYLLEHIDNPCTIRELAKEVGLNDCKLKKGFKEVYHNTVFGVLIDERMQKAKNLLLETELSVQEVATLTGYKNLSNFTAAFKRKFGFPPSALKH
jgi:AraC family transcriptional regulator, transcriptional activator of the genes for pyochelin and ferripyochelin receptors